MNAVGRSVSNRTNSDRFRTSTISTSPAVVFRTHVLPLELVEATRGGRRNWSTSFRSSVALASAASVCRSAWATESSAANRAFRDPAEDHHDQIANARESAAVIAEIQLSIVPTIVTPKPDADQSTSLGQMKMPPAVAPAEGVETPNVQEGISMTTLLEQSTHSPAAGSRPTREQCIQEAGAVLARALQLYVPASAESAVAA